MLKTKFKITKEFFFLIGLLLLVAIIRINLADLPLERDEGEFGYMAQLMLKGIAPYTQCYNLKMPLIYLIYQLKIMLFGETAEALRYGLLIANLISITLVFTLSKKLISSLGALISAAVFAFLTLSPNVLGQAAHANHYVVFFVLLAIWLILLDTKNKIPIFISGACMAVAVLTKQSSFIFPIFGLLVIMAKYKKISETLIYILGGIVLTSLIMLWLFVSGAFPNFWFFTIVTGLAIGGENSLTQILQNFIIMTSLVTKNTLIFWLIGLSGYLVLLPTFKTNNNWLKIIFFICSFISIVPGFYFRHHYYLTLIPAIALGNGIIADKIYNKLKIKISKKYSQLVILIILGIFCLPAFITEADFYLAKNKNILSRKIYGINPFPESPVIAKFLQENTNQNDKIAILGSEAQILYYSKLQSATGYIYTYHMVENHQYSLQMQMQMIREIESQKPKYLIFCNIITSWLFKPDSPNIILQWYERYVAENYKPAGIIDIAYYDKTLYVFDSNSVNYQPQSDNLILIWERI